MRLRPLWHSLRDDCNLRVVLEAPHDLHRTLAERLTKRGIMIEKLRQDHLAGNTMSTLERLARCDGLRVQLITRVEQGNPVACICENRVHGRFLGAPYSTTAALYRESAVNSKVYDVRKKQQNPRNINGLPKKVLL